MSRIPTWEQRLATMDHSRGTSNAMIQKAMQAEIQALRRAVAQSSIDAATRRELKRLAAHRDEWKDKALQYRASLKKLLRKRLA